MGVELIKSIDTRVEEFLLENNFSQYNMQPLIYHIIECLSTLRYKVRESLFDRSISIQGASPSEIRVFALVVQAIIDDMIGSDSLLTSPSFFVTQTDSPKNNNNNDHEKNSVKKLDESIAKTPIPSIGYPSESIGGGLSELIKAFPDSQKKSDGRSWMPLHWGLSLSSSTSDINYLIRNQFLNLHLGHLHNDPLKKRHFQLIKQDQEAIELFKEKIEFNENNERNLFFLNLPPPSGLTPFHILVSQRHVNMDLVKVVLKYHHSLCAIPDHNGWLPIHWCCFNNRDTDLLDMLLNIYYKSIISTCLRGKSPLHYAAKNRYSKMFKFLIDKESDIIDSKDYNGNSVLHDACKGLNPDVVKIILSIKPNISLERNFKEDLSIHKLLKSHLHYEEYIPTNNSTASLIQKAEDILPITIPKQSYLQSHIRQVQCIKHFLNLAPECFVYTDINHMTPLHLAIKYRASYEVIELIYNVYPKASIMKDGYGLIPSQYIPVSTSVINSSLVSSPTKSFTRKKSESALQFSNMINDDPNLLNSYQDLIESARSTSMISTSTLITVAHPEYFSKIRSLLVETPQVLQIAGFGDSFSTFIK